MPYINVSTSVKENKKIFLEEISILISTLSDKSKRFILAKLEDISVMYFDYQTPCCFLEIKSIVSFNASEMEKPISDFVNEKIGILIEKIYISFEDVISSLWSWIGRTFRLH